MLPLWGAIFGTLYQLTLIIWILVQSSSFISFCRGANSSGNYNFVKNMLISALLSYFPLVIISITFMWVGYDKDWEAAPVFVALPILSWLVFFLFLFGTRNDITNLIDTNRKGRKRLPVQAPPHLVVAPVQNMEGLVQESVTPQRRGLSMPPELPLQQTPRSGGGSGARRIPIE